MNHLNLKSLRFYGITIGLVVTLFSVVTAYGEANLKASKAISGDYLFQLTPLGCTTQNRLNLSIQQSGIYVNAALVNLAQAKPEREAALKQSTLEGQWQHQHLTLIGTVPQEVLCMAQAKASRATRATIKLQGSVNESTLSGTLLLNSSQKIAITAQRQAPLTESEPK